MPAYDLSELRVLVVDDNIHMCRLVRAMLGGLGMRKVTDAHDGAEALERIGQTHYDILIVDWEMPVLDGPDLVRLIRKPDHPLAYVPIIMITGHSTFRRTNDALGLGINDVLSKPFSPQALYDRIVDATIRPRPFLRSQNYFGPKPRLDNSERDPFSRGTQVGKENNPEAASGDHSDAFDLDDVANV
ncbi:MAG: response regulator [Devosiaceae bacterium]